MGLGFRGLGFRIGIYRGLRFRFGVIDSSIGL